MSAFAKLLASGVEVGVQQLIRRAPQLGVSWRLRPGRCVESLPRVATRVVLDGDRVAVPASSLVGIVAPGARVMALLTPAGGTYVVGSYGRPAVHVRPYSPQLVGTTTDPSLGSGGNFIREGLWYETDDFVHVWVRLRFGSSGVSNGAGNYRVSLPTPVSTVHQSSGAVAVGAVLGQGAIRDNSPVTALGVTVQLASRTGGPGGNGLVLMVVDDETQNQVTATGPWTWADSDAISLELRYLRRGVRL